MAVAAVVVGLSAGPAAGVGPTNDPEFANQYGLADIKAPDAWAKGKGAGISVAVVSTGIAKHPDLIAKTDAGFDATGADPTTDGAGRGTHLAGIVGAATDNGVGIAGVAPDARLLPYKAFESDTAVTGEGHLNALQRVLNARPQVVLVDVPDSFPAVAKDRLRQSLSNLAGAGIAVVVGAQSELPLGDLPVLTVAATTSKGDQAPGTAGVADRGVAAPGLNVISTAVTTPLLGGDPTFGYAEQSGTSQAAAHVAGAVAILRGLGATSTQAADLLRSTARKGTASLGAGTIDVAAAVAAYRPLPVPPTTTTTTNKGTAKPPSTKPPTGLGAIPAGPGVPSGPTGPLLPAEQVEPGAGESVVPPPGNETFVDSPGPGGPASPSGGGSDRPLGLLAVGFGLLFGVGTGLSLTFRRLAGAPL